MFINPAKSLTLLLLLLLLSQPLCATQSRHALVIGNAAYKNQSVLLNTLNDARDVAAQLKVLGFKVTKVENVGRRKLSRSVNDFVRQVKAAAALYWSTTQVMACRSTGRTTCCRWMRR